MITDQLTVNTIRLLSADAVQQANSGHPGLPLGAAPAAYALWARHLRHNPKDPAWFNRDRFVLSAGHGSSMLYALLHVFGYDVSIDDLRSFRRFGAKTPGHPEFGHTPGVEVTTGPLGQGIANAVGMAIAEKHLAEHFNRPGHEIVDHRTWALCGDGCLMEGVASEAVSLAGTLGLNKLTLLYDANRITIEGDTDIAFREDVGARFVACGWNVLRVEDGNDLSAMNTAMTQAAQEKDKPTLIIIRTEIGYGSPNKQGKASAHGEPLGMDELKLVKKALGFDPNEHFHVPAEVSMFRDEVIRSGEQAQKEWNRQLAAYAGAHPELSQELADWLAGRLPDDLFDESFRKQEGDNATRAWSGTILNAIAARVPNLVGGSADLAPSNKSEMKGRGDFSAETPNGANLHFGVREHAMAAIANGIALHGGLRIYTAGFFVFADYMKPAMRLAAMMRLPVIYLFTHDSIGVGEDGPTHQPIEQLAMLRSIPGMTVVRPCDGVETAAAWQLALTRKGPTALILTRQTLRQQKSSFDGALRGGYIVCDSKKAQPDAVLLATGSEVAPACESRELLANQGIDARVVSLPSLELFEEQDAAYRKQVLPASVRARVAVEAACDFGWHRYTGLDGRVVAMRGYGASAPAEQLFEHFGFSSENIAAQVKHTVEKSE